MIYRIISPKWEHFHDSLACMLDLSLGIFNAAGELITLYNPKPPYDGLARWGKHQALFRHFFLQALQKANRDGRVEILLDPFHLPAAVSRLYDDIFLFAAGGFAAANNSLLEATGHRVAALYRHIISYFQQGSGQDAASPCASGAEELFRLAGQLLYSGKLNFLLMYNLLADLLAVLCYGEAAFILNCPDWPDRRETIVYRGLHEDLKLPLLRQWRRSILKEDYLSQWRGIKKDEDLGLELHLYALTGEKPPLCFGVVNPRAGNTPAVLEIFGRQAEFFGEIFRFYPLFKEQFAFLFDSIRHGIVAVDAQGKIMVCNRPAVKVFSSLGLEPTAGKSLWEADLAPALLAAVKEALDRGSSRYLQDDVLQRGVRSIYVSWDTAPLLRENGEIAGAVLIFEDMTARRQSEEALRQQERECKALVENMPDIFARFDRNLCCLFVNKAIEKHTGVKRQEFVGKKIEDIMSLGENYLAVEQGLVAAFNNGKEIELDLVFNCQGTPRYFNTKFVPEFEKNGAVKSVLCISRDMTEQRLIEKEFLQTSKLKSIGDLAGGIAHDFNNFLATMLANISLAKLYSDDREKVLAKLESTEAAILRAKELTRQLFVFAQGVEPVKGSVDIKKLICESTAFALSGSNVLPEYYFAEDLLPVEIDQGQITQVIDNIVINAVQAMPQGGTITVRAENITLPENNTAENKEIIPLPPGEYVMISFADRGSGIPEELLKKIFDPFFSTKERGMGLGLATARTVMQQHNGLITVKSKKGAGSTFSIYLPAARGREQQEHKNGGLIRGRGKVLIMDDEKEIRETAAEMLSCLGYETAVAGDGVEAVKLYTEAKHCGNPFDVVLLDLTVPGGMGAKDTLKELLAVDPDVKAMVISGYPADQVMVNYRDYGFKDMAVKPFNIEQLSQKIYQLMT